MTHMTSFGVILLRKRFHLSWTSKQSKRREWDELHFHITTFTMLFKTSQMDMDGFFPHEWELAEVPATLKPPSSTLIQPPLKQFWLQGGAWSHDLHGFLTGCGSPTLELMTKSWNRPNGCTCISMIKKKGIAVAPPIPQKHNVTIMPTPSPRQYVEEYWLREGVLSVATYARMPHTSYQLEDLS